MGREAEPRRQLPTIRCSLFLPCGCRTLGDLGANDTPHEWLFRGDVQPWPGTQQQALDGSQTGRDVQQEAADDLREVHGFPLSERA